MCGVFKSTQYTAEDAYNSTSAHVVWLILANSNKPMSSLNGTQTSVNISISLTVII